MIQRDPSKFYSEVWTLQVPSGYYEPVRQYKDMIPFAFQVQLNVVILYRQVVMMGRKLNPQQRKMCKSTGKWTRGKILQEPLALLLVHGATALLWNPTAGPKYGVKLVSGGKRACKISESIKSQNTQEWPKAGFRLSEWNHSFCEITLLSFDLGHFCWSHFVAKISSLTSVLTFCPKVKPSTKSLQL